ncbi:MAG: hypothetical protein Q8M66_03395, partial [Actinomycetota bacterium]|nr:hypothetical protein [Actinomycetota bacterium]
MLAQPVSILLKPGSIPFETWRITTGIWIIFIATQGINGAARGDHTYGWLVTITRVGAMWLAYRSCPYTALRGRKPTSVPAETPA